MAEAFVRTIKRDDVRVSAAPDAAETVMRLLPSWLAHYNTLWTPPAARGMSAWSAVDATIYPACRRGDHAPGHDEDPLLLAS
jgi:putative transposase